MPGIDEDQLRRWTSPASESEQDRYEWTRNQIKLALSGGVFDNYELDIYPKGSYPNYTNVVRDSDVDIAVELTDIVRHDFVHGAEGMTLADFNLSRYSGVYSVESLKDDAEVALRRAFGSPAVERGNKAIHVRESQQGLKADVVICQTLIQHYGTGSEDHRQGIVISPDTGNAIFNFPRQHLAEGVQKNKDTQLRYKGVVRILKNLENKMVEERMIDPVPSFLIESMVWNVHRDIFNYTPSWTQRLIATLLHMDEADRSNWLEANGIKYLFRPSQKWTDLQANNFIRAARTYVGA